MKNYTTLLLLIITTSLTPACESTPEAVETSLHSSKIILDLEEEQFLFNAHWYPWSVSIIHCQPEFSVDLDWESSLLSIKQCNSEMTPASLQVHFQHPSCTALQSAFVETIEQRSFYLHRIQFTAETMNCLRQGYQFLELHLEWEED